MADIDYRKVCDFNRTLAVRLNVFGRHVLGTRWSLSEGRVIVELGRARQCTPSELAVALGMDEDTLGKMVAGLESAGIVEHAGGKTKGMRLTTAGMDEYRILERLSDEQAREMLEGLSDEEKRRAVDAMETVRTLLAKASTSPVRVVDGEGRVEDFADLVREYVTVEIGQKRGFDVSFQDPEAEIAHLPGKYARPNGAMFLAVVDDMPAGCIAYRRIDDRTCEMKRLYVRPTFRGRHVASVLTDAFYASAREAGYGRVVLDTDASMSEAIAFYLRMGFKPCEAYYDNPLPGARYFERAL